MLNILQAFRDRLRFSSKYKDKKIPTRARYRKYSGIIENFLSNGVYDLPEFGAGPESDLPLAIVPLLVDRKRAHDAAAVYQGFLGAAQSDQSLRPTHPRFQMYAQPGNARLGREYAALCEPPVSPGGAPPVPSLNEGALRDAVVSHSHLDTATLSKPDVNLLLNISQSYPRSLASLLYAIVARELSRNGIPSGFDPRELILALLIGEHYDAVARIARFRELGGQPRGEFRELTLVDLLRTGDVRGLVELIEAVADPTPFECLLQAIGDLEIIERENSAWRGYRCQANFARLRQTIATLAAFYERSALIRYVDARLSTLCGEFDRATGLFSQLAKVDTIDSLPHAHAMAAENGLAAGDVHASGIALEALFERDRSPDQAKQLSYLRHWLDRDADLLVWSQFIPASEPVDLTSLPPITSAAEARIPGAAIADHNFLIVLKVVPFITGTCSILRSEHEFVFSLTLNDLNLVLALGNGSAWFEILSIETLAIGKASLIKIRRADGYLYVHIGDSCVKQVALPSGFWMRGDTLVAAFPISAAEQVPVAIAVRINIERYRAGPAPRHVTFMSLFWGQEFAAMFADLMTPSLCALGELGKIAREFDVRFEVYVPGREAVSIEPALRLLRELPIDVRVYAGFLHDDAADNERDIGAYLTEVWSAHEREGCITVMAQPDHAFGSGLYKILTEFEANQYVVAGHPRVAKETGWAAVAAGFANGSIKDNADLVRISAREHPHVTFRTGLNANESWIRAVETEKGFTVFFKEPPPLAVQVKKDCLAVLTGSPYGKPFEQIDHDIVDLAYRQDRLRIVTDSREFFWLEMSSDLKSTPTIRNGYWSKAARVLSETPLHWYD